MGRIGDTSLPAWRQHDPATIELARRHIASIRDQLKRDGHLEVRVDGVERRIRELQQELVALTAELEHLRSIEAGGSNAPESG